MSNYIIQGQTLTDIADAIRAKTGDSNTINAEDMADAIMAISSGSGGGTITGIDLSNGCSFYTMTSSDTSKSGLDLSKISSAISGNKDFYYIGLVEEIWTTRVIAHFKGTQFQEMLVHEDTNGYDSSIETDLNGTTWPGISQMFSSSLIGFILVLN